MAPSSPGSGPERPGRGRARAELLGLAVGLGVSLAALARFGAHISPLRCPLKAATGLDCPLCGGTRALAALLHGQLGVALDQNLLAVTVVLPWLAAVGGRWALARWRGDPAPVPLPSWPALVLLAGFGVLRNLPGLAWLHSGLT